MSIERSSLSPDGEHIVWIGLDAQGVFRLQVSSSDSSNIKDIEVINTVPKEMALNEPPSKRFEVMFGGTPWDVPENYLKNSPLYRSDDADTPTLFLMGNPQKGGVDKYQTVFQLYYKLKSNGVDTQYKYYAEEGHIFEQNQSLKDALDRAEKWIDDHLGKQQ